MFAHDLYVEAISFQTRLTVFSKQLSDQNFSHFPLLLKSRAADNTSSQRNSGQRKNLLGDLPISKQLSHSYCSTCHRFSVHFYWWATNGLIDLQTEDKPLSFMSLFSLHAVWGLAWSYTLYVLPFEGIILFLFIVIVSQQDIKNFTGTWQLHSKQ